MNDYDKTYFQLLDIPKKPSMEVKRLRILITEVFKTLNNSNPVFMEDIFHYCQKKALRSITLMYIAVTYEGMETTAFVP